MAQDIFNGQSVNNMEILTKINRFDGGIANDLRIKLSNKFALTKHFDALTYPHKLVPHYKTESDKGIGKTALITKFLYAPWLSAGAYRLYGFGVVAGSTKAKVYSYDLSSFGGWGTPSKGESGLATRNTKVFFYYKNYIYMWANDKLIRFDTTNSDNFNDNYQSIAFTNVAQPVHHPSDDIAYFFSDNKVHSLNDTTFLPAVLTLPSDLKIVAGCPYGNYLAIACVSLRSFHQKSIVFLWDRDSSLATLTERIDFGEGEIIHIADLDNKLTAVMNYYLNSSLGLDKGKLLVKQAIGNKAKIINELNADDAVAEDGSIITNTDFLENDKLYFPASIPLNDDTRNGIWVLDSNGNLTLDFVEEEVDNATTKTYQGIFKTGNIWWIAHSADGSINRSDDGAAYSATLTSVYESLINGGNAKLNNRLTKKLKGVEVLTEPLPIAGRITLKYRKDDDIDGGDWTTIFTQDVIIAGSFVIGTKYRITVGGTTDFTLIGAADSNPGTIFTATGVGTGTGRAIDRLSGHGAINIESTGATLPQYKEIQFRIESLGGAIITGLEFLSEFIDNKLF